MTEKAKSTGINLNQTEIAILRTALKFKDSKKAELRVREIEKELIALELWREVKKWFDVEWQMVKFKDCALELWTQHKALGIEAVNNFGWRDIESLSSKKDLTDKLK